jgi:hypothetical protein
VLQPTTYSKGDKLLPKLHGKLLQGIMKKSITVENWEQTLKNKISREIREGNCTMETNPLEDSSYYRLPVRLKVHILKMLCEWQFDYSTKMQDFLRELKPGEAETLLRPEPLGKDKQKNSIWSFDYNESTPRLYRENPPTRDSENRLIPGKWETITTTIPQLQQYADSLDTSNGDERQLKNVIVKKVLPPLIEKEKQKEIAMKRLVKMEMGGVSVRNILQNGRTRRSRKEVNYAYEEDFSFIKYLE